MPESPRAALDPAVPMSRVLRAAVTVTLFGSLPVWLVGALAVQIDRDLPLGPTRLGLASSAFFGSAALGSALAGRAAERMGPRAAMRAATLAAVLVNLVLAGAPAYPVLLVTLAFGGATNALAQVGANLMIAQGVAPGRQGFSLAVKQAGVPAGTLIGGLAVPVLGVTVGWRWAFVAAAVGAASAWPGIPAVGSGRRPRDVPRQPTDLPVGLLVGLAVAVAFAAAANGSLATFLVSAGVDAGYSESAAGLLLTAGSAVGITMRLYAGHRADRRGERHLPVVATLLVGGAGGYLLLAPGTRPSHLLGALFAFGAGWAWPGLFNLAVVRANPSAPASATGITQTGVYVGGLAGPAVFGAVADAHGFGVAWTLAAASSALAAAGVLIGRHRIVRWRARSLHV